MIRYLPLVGMVGITALLFVLSALNVTNEVPSGHATAASTYAAMGLMSLTMTLVVAAFTLIIVAMDD